MVKTQLMQGAKLNLDQLNQSTTSWKAKSVDELRPLLMFDGVKIWRKTENVSDTIQRCYTVTESGKWALEVIWTDYGKVAEVITDNIFSIGWHTVKEFVQERNYKEIA